MSKPMTIGSCFSGIGGELVAASMMGWEVRFFCEINPFGHQVLSYWYPNATSYEDITKTDFTEWRGRVNVLTGGFPCQPFSVAGQRRGAEDDRYLWPHMHRCICEVRPDWVVCENVGGILSMVEQGSVSEVASETALFYEEDTIHRYEYRGTFTLERICRDLEADGYDVQPVLIPACAVGAPHRRDRVFIVGHRVDADAHGPGDSPQGKDATSYRQGAEIVQGPTGRGTRHASDGDNGLSAIPRSAAHADSMGRERTGRSEADKGRQDDLQASVRRETEGHGEGQPAAHAAQSGSEGMRQGRQDALHAARPAAHPDGGRGLQGRNCLESELADGEVALSDGRQRDAAHAAHQRAGGLRVSCGEEGLRLRDVVFGNDSRLRCTPDELGSRWRDFPTVAPVYGGGYGLPFPVDHLTIPFARWKNESIKAYGNAIVPQVMYEIFRAIEQVENDKHQAL